MSLTDFGNFSRLTDGRHNAHGYLRISRNVVIREYYFLRADSLLVGRQGTPRLIIKAPRLLLLASQLALIVSPAY